MGWKSMEKERNRWDISFICPIVEKIEYCSTTVDTEPQGQLNPVLIITAHESKHSKSCVDDAGIVKASKCTAAKYLLIMWLQTEEARQVQNWQEGTWKCSHWPNLIDLLPSSGRHLQLSLEQFSAVKQLGCESETVVLMVLGKGWSALSGLEMSSYLKWRSSDIKGMTEPIDSFVSEEKDLTGSQSREANMWDVCSDSSLNAWKNL